MQTTVLSIAGSDPTGGAGIQADIKTMTAIGVYAAAAPTCITVQNSYGVRVIEPLSPSLVAGQINAVLTDHHVTHIKIGMVGTPAIAEAIGRVLSSFRGEVIFDPVLASSTGQDLMEPDAAKSLHSSLINKTTVLTPNLSELAVLSELSCNTPREAGVAAKKILLNHETLRVLIIKGGHEQNSDTITDTMILKEMGRMTETPSSHPRSVTRNTHGTGCTFSSAYAAYHCLTGDDRSSFLSAVDFVQDVLTRSASAEVVKNLDGKGCMLHYRGMRSGSS